MTDKLIPTVRVECVSCKARKDIGPNDVEPGMVPFCDKCYSPMVAISAQVRRQGSRG